MENSNDNTNDDMIYVIIPVNANHLKIAGTASYGSFRNIMSEHITEAKQVDDKEIIRKYFNEQEHQLII